MDDNKVSVIITTYNTDDSLRRAVESVKNQSYTPVEIIVVDDNNPGTAGRTNAENIMRNFAGDPDIKYIRHECNKNGSAARNTGIRNASGSFIAFLDDDDIYFPGRIEVCVNALNLNPDYDAVYTAVSLVSPKGEKSVRTVEKSGYLWKELFMNEGLLGTGSNLFLRTDAVTEVNGFDESFRRYQDIEFMLRILQNHQMLAVNEVLVEKNICGRNSPAYANYRAIRKKVFSTFQYLIDQLSESERQYYYIKNYKVLLNLALTGQNRKEILQAADELKQFRKLTWKEELCIHFPVLWKIVKSVG